MLRRIVHLPSQPLDTVLLIVGRAAAAHVGGRIFFQDLGETQVQLKVDVLLEEPVFGIKPVTFFSRDLICQVQITACEILSFVFGHGAHSEHLENVCSS